MELLNDQWERTPEFAIIEKPSKDDLKIAKEQLEKYNMEQTNGEWNKPETELNLVLRNHEGDIIGGINADTTLGTMFIEEI
jgi:hypothetical protein